MRILQTFAAFEKLILPRADRMDPDGRYICLIACRLNQKKALDIRYNDMITFPMLPRQLTLPPHPPAKLTPSPSYSCSLFALFSALPSFRINHLQPLFVKHPGGGYRDASMGHLELLSSEKERRQNCSSITSFRINTCKSVSKQSTLTTFRMNTYAKRGEGGR